METRIRDGGKTALLSRDAKRALIRHREGAEQRNTRGNVSLRMTVARDTSGLNKTLRYWQRVAATTAEVGRSIITDHLRPSVDKLVQQNFRSNCKKSIPFTSNPFPFLTTPSLIILTY